MSRIHGFFNFVAAWINLYMHLGKTTTNRAKCAHAKLKRRLGSSQGNFDTSWTRIHALLELQHTDIKASFEKSLGIVQHNFKPTLFKELRGFTSITALNLIFQESKRADDIGIDKVACGCVIQQTRGLPCAHEISENKIESRPIPLSRVHSHWKKLDLVPLDKGNTFEINCASLLEMIEKRYRDNNDHMKVEILQKLKEIASPSFTSLVEPQVQTKTKGHPSSKIDVSTRRDWSYFELVLSEQGNMLQQLDSSITPINQPTLSSQPPIRQKQKVYRARRSKSVAYYDSFPIHLRSYIMGVKDVASDGNCRFRAVANIVGIGEDNCSSVRKDLIKELESHFDDYSRLYGNDDMVHELIYSLSHFNGYASREYWMTMPNMGYVIASRYNVITPDSIEIL